MGGRLSEMALSFNRARQKIEHAQDAQQSYEHSLANFRKLSKTFDHTALFSMGPAKPVTVAVPSRTKWEGLSIDRCNLSTPGLRALDVGKVSLNAKGSCLIPRLLHSPLMNGGRCVQATDCNGTWFMTVGAWSSIN